MGHLTMACNSILSGSLTVFYVRVIFLSFFLTLCNDMHNVDSVFLLVPDFRILPHFVPLHLFLSRIASFLGGSLILQVLSRTIVLPRLSSFNLSGLPQKEIGDPCSM